MVFKYMLQPNRDKLVGRWSMVQVPVALPSVNAPDVSYIRLLLPVFKILEVVEESRVIKILVLGQICMQQRKLSAAPVTARSDSLKSQMLTQ